MITDISSKLSRNRIFQFVGISHSIKEVASSLDSVLRYDVILLEDCYSYEEMHEFIKLINARSATLSKGRRVYKVLVAPSNAKKRTHEEVSDLGFDVYINQDDPTQLIIEALTDKIFSNTCHLLEKYLFKLLNCGLDIDNFNEELSDILHSVGIPASLLGYKFLKTAIEMAFINIDCVTSGVTKVVYPTIALMFRTSPTKVERGMRHAIEAGWQRGDVEIMDKIFSYSYSNDKGKPTNGEFIANIADYLLVKFRNERKKFLVDHAEEISKINALIEFTDIEDLITNS